jgi:endonuclease/exonuclease/phosphatase family metal-dependent hydrolase
MKLRLLLAFGAIVLFAGCKQKNNITVIGFYNCENFFDTKHDRDKLDEDFTPDGKFHYTDRIYHEKQDHIASVIKAMGTNINPDGPALVGLVEIENNTVLDGLVSNDEIADRHYKYEWYNGPDPRGINVALLYDPARFTVLKSEPLHVSLPDKSIAFHTRDVLHVYGILQGDTVHVFVNHWPSRRGEEEEMEDKRNAAAMVDKDAIAAIMQQDPNSKVIVMGDFNDNPNDESITKELGATGDKNNLTNTGLYDPFANIYDPASTGTEIFKDSWNLFDQIMVSKAFLQGGHKLHYEKAEIFKPDFIVDHYKKHDGEPHRSFAGTHWIHGYSDHFPVLMYLAQ